MTRTTGMTLGRDTKVTLALPSPGNDIPTATSAVAEWPERQLSSLRTDG